MTVSVIIPTLLERPSVGRCVEAACASAARCGPDAEVILVVNGRAAASPTVPHGPGLRVLRSAAVGVAAARNDGVATARHDTILFTDDDVVVPPDWCARMTAPMRASAAVHAVAAPVRMPVLGPVTAFLEHERAFDATPLGADRAATVVTANAGYRRDRFPGVPFDARRYPHFGEDNDLGLRIRAAGGAIAWLSGAQRPEHAVEEDLGSMIGRALRTGMGCARIYLQRGILDYYLPAAATAYAGLADGAVRGWRRYSEVDDPSARSVFATLGLLRMAATIAGYLAELGRAHGVRLVDIDEPNLVHGLTAIFDGLVEHVGVDADRWGALPVRLADVADHGVRPPPLSAIGAVLHRCAPMLSGVRPPAAATRDDLSWLGRQATSTGRLEPLWRRYRVAEPTPSEFERGVRAAGMTVGKAYLAREQHAGFTVRRWPGAPRPAVPATSAS